MKQFFNRWSNLIFFCFLFETSLLANKQDEDFYQAAKLAQEGEYQKALNLYTCLETQGPVTYYNSGVMAYYLQDYSKALVFWRKAERYASSGLLKKIQHNTVQVQEKLQVSADPEWYKILLSILAHCSYLLFQWVFLVAWFLMWISWLFSCSVLKKMRYLICFMVLLTGAILVGEYWNMTRREAIVMVQEAKIFAGPREDFHEIGLIKQGEQVKVVGEEESWYKMLYRNSSGWMRKLDLEQTTVE